MLTGKWTGIEEAWCYKILHSGRGAHALSVCALGRLLEKVYPSSLGAHQSRADDWDRDGEWYVAVRCDGKSEREAAFVFSSRRPGHAAHSARTPERLHVKACPPRSMRCRGSTLVLRCDGGMEGNNLYIL